MATIQIAAALPSLPTDWTAEKDFKSISHITHPTARSLEPVGPHFLAHARRKRHHRTFSEDERIQAESSVKKTEDEDAGEISEDEDPVMLQREAKDWKHQDHYAVMGLSKYRWRATEEQIKRAHRKKVLRHHPDKKAASGKEEGDQFFKCIQRANDILMDPVKRRQFDSVDEGAEKEPPAKKDASKKPGSFYKAWGPVFEAEGRFSKRQPVPQLGNDKSNREEVEQFYNFWFDFDSWRSFEYLDEDVPDDSADRAQLRHQERKNNNARKKRKVEDTTRLRQLVESVMAQDDRIRKFKQEASKQKNAKKNEREAAEKAAKEEVQRKKEEDEKLAKEKAETEKATKDEGKKAKEAAKNAAKKNKRTIRGAAKEAGYFVEGEAGPKEIDAALNDVDALIAKMENEELGVLASKLQGTSDKASIKGVFQEDVTSMVAAGKVKDGEFKSLS
ncbi:Zuotin [Friedmanniomyces endolithicus]|nr:Zuotin [Friedmanniomyces endolithicus]KAK0866718.1 Zuotin [Friedmanniomyces endolithicus]KAK0958955.1 Zuotin [Friedmanniomyces endolithicus]